LRERINMAFTCCDVFSSADASVKNQIKTGFFVKFARGDGKKLPVAG